MGKKPLIADWTRCRTTITQVETTDLLAELHKSIPAVPTEEGTEILNNIKRLLTELRRVRNNKIRDQKIENMEKRCEKKREKLDFGKKGIQQAMEALFTNVELTRIQTTHPDTVVIE